MLKKKKHLTKGNRLSFLKKDDKGLTSMWGMMNDIQCMWLNLIGPSPSDARILGNICVRRLDMHKDVFHLEFSRKSISFTWHVTFIEYGARVEDFFVVTPDNTGGPCEYFAFSKSKFKWAGHSNKSMHI